MIEQLDQKTKERVNKAIGNVRLIASRSKRAQLLDATQRAETIVNLLADFRRYINENVYIVPGVFETIQFRHDTDTYLRIKIAIEETGNLYHNLSHSKQVSYKEEYKQLWLLLGDVREYLVKITNGSVSNA